MAASRSPAQDATLARILHHLSELNRKDHFAERFAKENQMPVGLVYTLINEYGKYLLIVSEGRHPVSPPHLIDKIWHQHLLYTEAYWGDLCPNILGMPLHHIPPNGSKKEAAQFDDWAAQTLQSYREFFGEPPPIWLAPKDTRNRPLLQNIGFALGGAALGTRGLSLWFGHLILAAVCTMLLFVPSVILFAIASGTPALKYPLPQKIEGPHTAATCGGNTSAASMGGSTSDGGHGGGGHSCGGH